MPRGQSTGMITEWHEVEKKLIAAGSGGPTLLQKINRLTLVANSAGTPALKVYMLVRILQKQFYLNPYHLEHIPLHVWTDCLHNLHAILENLQLYPNIIVSKKHPRPPNIETMKGKEYKGEIRIFGSLTHLLKLLYFEFLAGLKVVDPETQEYAERLERDEHMLIHLFQQFLAYFECQGYLKEAAKTAFMLLQLYYYKPNESCRIWIDKLVPIVTQCLKEESKSLAILWDIYHLSIIDEFSKSRDLLLQVSYLKKDFQEDEYFHDDEDFQCKDDFDSQDDEDENGFDSQAAEDFQNKKEFQYRNLKMKLYYYRAIAQLGLCAFRAGLIEESHNYLSELYAGGRVEELLYQGDSCQVPYHLCINLELLEAVYLICCMLLEVSNTAANARDTEGKVISKTFSNTPEASKSQGQTSSNVLAPILDATSALSEGKFQKCFSIIKSLDFWRLLKNRDTVLQMLKTKIESVPVHHV